MAETAYFKKILLTTKVRLSNGKDIPWINVGWQTGALETSDELIIKELSALAKQGKGGVLVIDQATFEDLKKNSVKPSPRLEWKPTVSGEQKGPLQPSQTSRKAKSEKSSKSAVADNQEPKPAAEQPATATGVFPAA